MARSIGLFRAADPVLPEPKPEISPERQALAQRITEARDARELLATTEGALAQADQILFAALAVADAAELAVEEAKGLAVQHMRQTAAGMAGTAPVTVRAARVVAAEASDDVQSAREARASLAAELLELRQHAPYPAERVVAAAAAVVAASPNVLALVLEARSLQRQMVDKCAALSYLLRKNAAPAGQPGEPDEARGTLAEQTIRRFESPATSWRALMSDATLAGYRPWEAALMALMIDASAPLPK